MLGAAVAPMGFPVAAPWSPAIRASVRTAATGSDGTHRRGPLEVKLNLRVKRNVAPPFDWNNYLFDSVVYHSKFTSVVNPHFGQSRPMATTRLGRVQLSIMQVLWERGRATARDITELLSRRKPIAHSTVQTLLRKLEQKGAVTHTVEDRTFVFRPAVDRQSVTRSTTRDLIEGVFGGSAAGLIAHLLREERISKAEVEHLRQLIDQTP